jgi:uncharacterized protein YkwD
MTWSSSLASVAEAYAKVLAAKQCGLVHSTPAMLGRVGENLYSSTSYPQPQPTCKGGIDAWYSEVAYYKFNTTSPFTDNWSKGIGHFTALVWLGTTQVGCGVGMNTKSGTMGSIVLGCKVVACQFLPPGNMASNAVFAFNVRPRV